jgi:hypothetical protein
MPQFLHQNTIVEVVPQKDHFVLVLGNEAGAFALRKGSITPKKNDILTTEHIKPFSFRSPAKRIYINGERWSRE